MTRLPILALLVLLAACGGKPSGSPTSAAVTPTDAVATLGTLQLRTTAIAADSLQADVAQRYGITRTADTLVVLVMVRNAQGDAVPVHGLQLRAQAALLGEPQQSLPLRAIATGGFTDYIGTLQAKPPTTVRVQIDAQHGGATTTQSFSRDLYRR